MFRTTVSTEFVILKKQKTKTTSPFYSGQWTDDTTKSGSVSVGFTTTGWCKLPSNGVGQSLLSPSPSPPLPPSPSHTLRKTFTSNGTQRSCLRHPVTTCFQVSPLCLSSLHWAEVANYFSFTSASAPVLSAGSLLCVRFLYLCWKMTSPMSLCAAFKPILSVTERFDLCFCTAHVYPQQHHNISPQSPKQIPSQYTVNFFG